MKLKVTIAMDNAAFEAFGAGNECARILRDAARKLEGRDLPSKGTLFSVMDSNGNKVGEVKVTA